LEKNNIRCFIALELSEELKTQICNIQKSFSKLAHGYVKWVAPQSVHLTLKFLGDIQVQTIDRIVSVLSGVAAKTTPFSLGTTNLGVFPNFNRPAVLWIGIDGDIRSLLSLHAGIDTQLEPLGFHKEKRVFSPHLTLARLKETATSSGIPQAKSWKLCLQKRR